MEQMVLSIPDMSCGHCKAAVAKAIATVDPQATVDIDLDRRRASVSSTAGRDRLIAALSEAGYTAEPAG